MIWTLKLPTVRHVKDRMLRNATQPPCGSTSISMDVTHSASNCIKMALEPTRFVVAFRNSKVEFVTIYSTVKPVECHPKRLQNDSFAKEWNTGAHGDSLPSLHCRGLVVRQIDQSTKEAGFTDPSTSEPPQLRLHASRVHACVGHTWTARPRRSATSLIL